MTETDNAAPSYSLYILRCGDRSLYTGISTDVERRLKEHRDGIKGARYLRGRRPLKLVFSQVVGDRSRASQLEYQVKRLSRSDKEALIAGLIKLDRMLEPEPG